MLNAELEMPTYQTAQILSSKLAEKKNFFLRGCHEPHI